MWRSCQRDLLRPSRDRWFKVNPGPANIRCYGLPVVVAINKFPLDTEAELEAVHESCKKRNVDVVISDVWQKVELVVVTWLKSHSNWPQEEIGFSYVCDEEEQCLKQN